MKIWVPLILILAAFPARADRPVWLLGNDFHTSLVFRARDIPFLREITACRDADEVAIGWGASADYRGPSTLWTVLQAIFPDRAALHVVPFRGPVTRRFPHCDVVLLRLSDSQFQKLISEVNDSFAIRDHHRVLLGPGYRFYPCARFYASREYFFFPMVCNMWVAIKLGRAGIHFFLPRAILSNSLILQAGEKGTTLQRHSRNPERY